MSFLHSRKASAREGIGQPVPRKEDERLLRGAGCYSDDFSLPGQAYASMVRSPHAHARIRGIDIAGALAAPGVIAVLTGADAAHDGLKPIPYRPISPNPHEVQLKASFLAPCSPLPADRARFVGQAVAVVVAETLAAAKDGAERVEVDYEPLPAVVATRDAADGPLVWSESGSNLCVDTVAGDATATESAFHRAAHVVRLETTLNRVTGVPMEPRAALGSYDEASGRYLVHASSAATTERATIFIPSLRSSPGPRSGCGGRSSGPASAARPSSATSMRAISCRMPSWRSTAKATFLRYAASIRAMSAHTRCRSFRSPRAWEYRPACTASRWPRCADARC